MKMRWWTAALALLLLAAPGAAQQAGFELTARAGVLFAGGTRGPVAPAAPGWLLELAAADATPAVELAATLPIPSRSFSVRVLGMATRSATAEGRFTCYPGLACPALLMETKADVSLRAAVADVLLRPTSVLGLEPFVALGAGVKQFRYDWPAASNFVQAGDNTETLYGVHAGAGFSFGLFGGRFEAEVADYWNAEGRAFGVGEADPSNLGTRHKSEHDVAVSLGWRLLRF